MYEAIAFAAVALIAINIGFVVGRISRGPNNTETAIEYMRTYFPDIWTSYQRGIREGYAQGHRDCQEQQ